MANLIKNLNEKLRHQNVKKIDACILDKDGLMIDTETMQAACFAATMREFNLDLPDKNEDPEKWFLTNCVGMGRPLIKGQYSKILPENVDVEVFFKAYDDAKKVHCRKNGVPVKKGLFELLRFLKERNMKTGVNTTAGMEGLDLQFECAGIDKKQFHSIVTGTDLPKGRGKPHPDGYLKSCENLGVAPDQALGFEDSDLGIESGYNAGMKMVLVPDIQKNSKETKKRAFATVDSLEKAPQIIDAINKSRNK